MRALASLASLATLVSLISLFGGAAGAVEPPPTHFGGGPLPQQTVDCISPAERAAVERNVAAFLAKQPLRAKRTAAPLHYAFIPQAGNLWEDLSVNNYVDLDPTTGIKDWDCTDWTYDGHQGWDIDLRTFAYEDIGVPIFAALDGTVADAHDGEWDHNTKFINGALANYVVLYHGGTQYTYYWHMRRGSVAVSVGQTVKAGQQLGLTGSSGNSTAPHLHFESRLNGAAFEPAAGACNPGDSNWVSQPSKPGTLYVREANLTDAFLDGYPDMPWEHPRTGTFLAGNGRNVEFWVELGAMPANSTWRLRYIRPNGSVALDSSTNAFNNSSFYRESWWWFWYWLNLDATGQWTAEFSMNGNVLVQAPFTVVSSYAQVTNRPPNPISVTFDPPAPKASDVVFCRLTSPMLLGDPDYDVVRYHYVWTVNHTVVRDVVSAGRSDAVPHDVGVAGATLECTVTPSDGQLSGPPASAQATLGSTMLSGDVDGNGLFELPDILLATRIAGGLAPSDPGEVARGHSGAGTGIGLTDATLLYRHLLGL